MTQARKAHVATGTLPRGLLVTKEVGGLEEKAGGQTFATEIEGEEESTACGSHCVERCCDVLYPPPAGRSGSIRCYS